MFAQMIAGTVASGSTCLVSRGIAIKGCRLLHLRIYVHTFLPLSIVSSMEK